MNTAWVLVALAIGAILGSLYFGGLWLTVRKLSTAQQPALLLLASFVVRAALVLFGFYFVMDGRWEPLASCLAGFLLARTFLIRRLGDVAERPAAAATAPGSRSPAG